MQSRNVVKISHTFLLCIMGTLLTRSGLVSSVHAFAQSSIGSWFFVLLGISFAVCLFFYIKNRDHLKTENKLVVLVTLESSFLFNNLVLWAACFSLLWVTFVPCLP